MPREERRSGQFLEYLGCKDGFRSCCSIVPQFRLLPEICQSDLTQICPLDVSVDQPASFKLLLHCLGCCSFEAEECARDFRGFSEALAVQIMGSRCGQKPAVTIAQRKSRSREQIAAWSTAARYTSLILSRLQVATRQLTSGVRKRNEFWLDVTRLNDHLKEFKDCCKGQCSRRSQNPMTVAPRSLTVSRLSAARKGPALGVRLRTQSARPALPPALVLPVRPRLHIGNDSAISPSGRGLSAM